MKIDKDSLKDSLDAQIDGRLQRYYGKDPEIVKALESVRGPVLAVVSYYVLDYLKKNKEYRALLR